MLSYIDDFGCVASNKTKAPQHFEEIHATLQHLGQQEAAHKASVPAQVMIRIGLKFDTVNITVTIAKDKMNDTLQLVDKWS